MQYKVVKSQIFVAFCTQRYAERSVIAIPLVRPFVRQILLYCAKTAEYIDQFLSQTVSHAMLVYWELQNSVGIALLDIISFSAFSEK